MHALEIIFYKNEQFMPNTNLIVAFIEEYLPDANFNTNTS